MNTLGTNVKLTSYGESHGLVVGAILDGFPAGFQLDMDKIQAQLDRRRPGQSRLTTQRSESDAISIDSGVFKGITTGAPIHFQLKNKDAKSSDYDHLANVYRPSHADYTYEAKYGIRDYRGGGRSSARVTAGWVAGGALVQDYLFKSYGIKIGAFVKQIGAITYQNTERFYSREEVDASEVRCPEVKAAAEMVKAIEDARDAKDSLGGVVECVITGLEAGVGDPVFGKLHAKLAYAMMSINAVKGFEIGGGFAMTEKLGSEVNDSFVTNNGKVHTTTNYSGGVQGGISNGMNVVFRVGFKPTATIGITQQTTDKEGGSVELAASGRHDPCVVPRAVPIVETMAALVIGDLLIK